MWPGWASWDWSRGRRIGSVIGSKFRCEWLGVGEGVGAGELARGALVVGADFAPGELMEKEAALFVEGLGSDHLTAEVAKLGEPVAEVKRELFVDFFAELLGEGWRVAGGGDGDLEVSATDDGREVEVTEGRVVDGVAENSGRGGFAK